MSILTVYFIFVFLFKFFGLYSELDGKGKNDMEQIEK